MSSSICNFFNYTGDSVSNWDKDHTVYGFLAWRWGCPKTFFVTRLSKPFLQQALQAQSSQIFLCYCETLIDFLKCEENATMYIS